MPGIPSFHAIAAMAVTIAMFVGFARGRLSVEIVSLLTIAAIAVGLYFFPLDGTSPTDGLALAFGGFGLVRGASGSRGELKLRATAACTSCTGSQRPRRRHRLQWLLRRLQ